MVEIELLIYARCSFTDQARGFNYRLTDMLVVICSVSKT